MSRGIASTVQTQKRGLGGLIFSSPVMSATASLPARCATLLYTSRARRRSGNPIIPDEWASIRSIAKWVLPVLVGPSTAVTPAPRAPLSRATGEAKESAIGISATRGTAVRSRRGSCLYHNATGEAALSRQRQRKGTRPERIAAESLTLQVSRFVLLDI